MIIAHQLGKYARFAWIPLVSTFCTKPSMIAASSDSVPETIFHYGKKKKSKELKKIQASLSLFPPFVSWQTM